MYFVQLKVKNDNTSCYTFGQQVTYISQCCLLHFHHSGAGVLGVMRMCVLICEFDMVHLSCGLEADLRQRAKHEEI